MKLPKFKSYLALFGIVLAMHPASLVAAPDAATQNNQSTETSSDQAKQEKTEGLSNAEQILKIEANIEADGKRIQELKKELEIKQKTFTRISDGLKNLGKQKAEKEQQLAEQADQKGPTAQDLKQDIESLSREYELFNTQANLNLKAQKTLQEQIKGLEEKRLNDKNLLDGLKGKITVEDTGQTEKVQTIPGRPAEDITPAIKTPLPIPSTPAETAPEKEEEVEALATPEQIEAQKEEQEKRAEAKQAEQIVVDYVERKKALENQIRREQQLLDNEIQSRSNIENYLSTLDGKLDKARQEGKQEDIKQLQKDIPDIRKELRRVQNDIVARSVLLNQLHQQLTEVQAGQLQAVETAEEKRQAAETARQKNVWLQSPLHPHNIAQWVMTRGPRVLLVIALMILLLFISRVSVKRVARAVSRKGRGSIEGRVNRAETIALSMDAVLRLLIYVGGTFLVLEEAGVDIKTILGGAAIIGLAFAFGAQNLMRDYFSGIMILMEDQYELGDVVTVGNVTGVVERVNMRATVLRDIEGRVHFIPNGEIKQVTNRTYEWAQAVFDINVSYKENVDEVMTLLMELAKQLQEDPDYRDYILSDPVMLGVNEFGNAAVTIKFMIKTQADKMWPIRREMLRRIKNKFDEVGIQIPIQQREVFQVTSD